VPPADRLIQGDLRETLPEAGARFRGTAALAHMDVATGEAAASLALAAALLPALLKLLRSGAVIVSEPPLDAAALLPEALPDAVAPGRYHLYRRR
jgi:hypothetical protein